MEKCTKKGMEKCTKKCTKKFIELANSKGRENIGKH